MVLKGLINSRISLSGSASGSPLAGRSSGGLLNGDAGWFVILSGVFSFGFADPWLLYRAVWSDANVWVDGGSWRDDLS